MIRPNIAMDAPPETLTIDGARYDINTDYRVWIDVMARLGRLNLTPTTEKAAKTTAEGVNELMVLLFGHTVKINLGAFLRAVVDFSKGYASAPVKPMGGSGERTYDFEYDINEIVLAIRNQSGIDISYRCEHFHWWLFLLEFKTLCGDHYILNLMDTRGYKGKDQEMKKRKQAVALPVTYSDEDLEALEMMQALLDGEGTEGG